MRIKDGSDFMIPRGESRFRVVFSVRNDLNGNDLCRPFESRDQMGV